MGRKSIAPHTIRSVAAMGKSSDDARCRGERIGFVPTLGALHDGHAALIRAARARCDRVVVSIFVNPTQFGPGEDLTTYPRTLAADRRVAADAGADVLFVPATRAIYPQPSRASVAVPTLSRGLCGPHRPGHFEGVCLIVNKLLNIVRPDELYLGQKDAQQAAVLKRMIADLNMPVVVRVVATVRERDGLAMSSRNAYLSPRQRAYAPRLYESLRATRRAVRDGEVRVSVLRRRIERHLAGGEGRVEYVEIVDPSTLEPVRRVEGRVLVAMAVWVGKARLIDNISVGTPRRGAAPAKGAR